MSTRAFTALDKKWEDVVERWKTEELTCSVCGQRFLEIDNIGSWGNPRKAPCGQHADIRRIEPGEKWPCCGKKQTNRIDWSNKGCVRSDHNVKPIPFDETDDVAIPVQLISYLTGYRLSLMQEGYLPRVARRGYDSTSHIVRRFDASASDQQGRNRPLSRMWS
jgi:hypothetical protein